MGGGQVPTQTFSSDLSTDKLAHATPSHSIMWGQVVFLTAKMEINSSLESIVTHTLNCF